jgi:hypothetical protein
LVLNSFSLNIFPWIYTGSFYSKSEIMRENLQVTISSAGTLSKFSRLQEYYPFRYPCPSAETCSLYEVVFQPGLYYIECWGGGDEANSTNLVLGGRGEYASGSIVFHYQTKLFINIGSKGSPSGLISYNWEVRGSSRPLEGGGARGLLRAKNAYPGEKIHPKIPLPKKKKKDSWFWINVQ